MFEPRQRSTVVANVDLEVLQQWKISQYEFQIAASIASLQEAKPRQSLNLVNLRRDILGSKRLQHDAVCLFMFGNLQKRWIQLHISFEWELQMQLPSLAYALRRQKAIQIFRIDMSYQSFKFWEPQWHGNERCDTNRGEIDEIRMRDLQCLNI
jgi:hypothetical protein